MTGGVDWATLEWVAGIISATAMLCATATLWLTRQLSESRRGTYERIDKLESRWLATLDSNTKDRMAQIAELKTDMQTGLAALSSRIDELFRRRR